jgi:hypothetical protein
VIVVRSLGYRYLGVDVICINRRCEIDKQAQMNIMDRIYGGADLTIVAATSLDASDLFLFTSSALEPTSWVFKFFVHVGEY